MNYINQNKEVSYSCKKYERMLRVAFCTVLLRSASAASAATITVDDGGWDCYTSIQAVVDNANGDSMVDCKYPALAIARYRIKALFSGVM